MTLVRIIKRDSRHFEQYCVVHSGGVLGDSESITVKSERPVSNEYVVEQELPWYKRTLNK